MDLNVVYVVDRDAVAEADGKRVAGEYSEIGGVFEHAAQAPRSEHRVVGKQPVKSAVFAVLCHYAEALVAAADYVDHSHIGHDEHVAQRAHFAHELGGYLPAGAVLVEADPRAGMAALARVGERTVGAAGKAHAAGDEVVDELLRVSYHAVDRGGVVLVVAGAHGVFEVALIVGLVHQPADAALGEVAVRLVGGVLADYEYLFVPWQVERAVEPCNARAHDYNVVILFKLYHKTSGMARRDMKNAAAAKPRRS